MTLVAVLFFTVTLSAGTMNFDGNDPEIKKCTTTVSVDCDGDGVADYTATVSCEYGAAMTQQFIDSCPKGSVFNNLLLKRTYRKSERSLLTIFFTVAGRVSWFMRKLVK